MAGRYQITERVDQGGMAEVFRGVAESLEGFKKNVAIKRILPNLTKNKKFVSMFLDEARLSLHLQHANIVHVFDIGIADTAYFIVMEYVDGCNLKAIIESQKKHQRRLKVGHTVYLMIEVCKGLAYAHEVVDSTSGQPLGIVHRDISPPNILVSRMGEVKLVDFGLAKATSQLESTDPGVVKGKFSYLSPEAASGVEVDHRADIFAVGILLWEMLTGKRLFYGDTDYQTVELVRQAKVPSIQALNPDVDPELEAVVRKTLARDPRDRYQHAADLQDALAQVLFSRGMKVTSRDIATLVKDVVAERLKDKKVTGRPSQSLIDALILEEMNKFTSLDDLAPTGAQAGARPLSPEQGGPGGQSPLDPGSFVDTSNWADELGNASSAVPAIIHDRPPQQTGAVRVKPTTTAPPIKGHGQTAPPQPRAATPVPRAQTQPGEIDSLQQILEPDRTGVHKQLDDSPRRGTVIVVALVVLVGLVGGGLFLFKDKLFGGGGQKSVPQQKK